MTADSAQENPSAPLSAQADLDSALARIALRLIPFLCLLFVLNYFDRTNVAMAKLQMLGDAHLSDATYGLGAGLFFIGYFLFELPSNLILHRVGARLWIARIMITWGVISALMMFVRGPWSFYTLRFLLGVAEAGFFPGCVLYLTNWLPSSHRARILAVFLTSVALSGLIGNPVAGGLLKLDGVGGLRGWQWIFLIEGIPPVMLGVAMLALPLMPQSPSEARWLSSAQAQAIHRALAAEHPPGESSPVAALRQAALGTRLWLLSAIYFLLIMGLYGFIYWAPTLVKAATHTSDAVVGILSAIPYLAAAVAMVLLGRAADFTGRRHRYVIACALLGAAGIGVVALTHSGGACLAGLCIAAIGIFGTLSPFWTIPTRYLRGRAAAGGIAIINSAGALSGFVAPTVIGVAKSRTGSFAAGLWVVAASLALAAIFSAIAGE